MTAYRVRLDPNVGRFAYLALANQWPDGERVHGVNPAHAARELCDKAGVNPYWIGGNKWQMVRPDRSGHRHVVMLDQNRGMTKAGQTQDPSEAALRVLEANGYQLEECCHTWYTANEVCDLCREEGHA